MSSIYYYLNLYHDSVLTMTTGNLNIRK